MDNGIECLYTVFILRVNWVKIGGYTYHGDSVVLVDRAPILPRSRIISVIKSHFKFIVDDFLRHYYAFSLVSISSPSTSIIM